MPLILNSTKITQAILFTIFIINAYSYIDIQVQLNRQSSTGIIAYNIPIQINQHSYHIQASFQNKQQFLIPINQTQKVKKQKKNHKNPKNLFGLMKVSSLQGYTFEGWKRFFMEALLYIQSRYYHQITVNLDFLQQKENTHNLSSGLMTFGPNLQNNTFFNQIKKNTEFINQNIISIYSGRSNGKAARIQLGGYQQSFAYGNKNGYLFNQIPLKYTTKNWLFEPQKIYCSRQKSKRWDEFIINFSQEDLLLKLSLESQFLILPEGMKDQVQRSFLFGQGQCFIQNQSLTCQNMSNIDLALSMFSFKYGDAFLNISLYDLKSGYIQKQNKTTFFVKFDQNSQNWQLGATILKSHYIALDMSKKLLIYSPINRFPDSIFSTVYLIRFIVGFILFTICVGIGAQIWQTWANPYRRNLIKKGKDGVRLVSYSSPQMQADYED